MEDNQPAEGQSAGGAPGAAQDTVQEEARSIVRGAFRLFAGHTQRMTDDLAEFNEKRRQTADSLGGGARRTSGRIV